MMARQTKKRVQAEITARSVAGASTRQRNDELYKTLETAGYVWDATISQWVLGTTSLFKAVDGQASGIIRLRVMAHPDDLARAEELLRKTPGFVIDDVSGMYPNRKGAGARIYMTALMKEV